MRVHSHLLKQLHNQYYICYADTQTYRKVLITCVFAICPKGLVSLFALTQKSPSSEVQFSFLEHGLGVPFFCTNSQYAVLFKEQ